jgi:ABC-2 type transport system permease protein
MRSLFVLIRPRLLTTKNRWRLGGKSSLNELGMALMSLLLMTAVFICTRAALSDTEKILGRDALRIEIPLAMTLSTLFFMILLSASVTALGALFLSKDLDLVLSAPLTRWQLLLGKIGEVTLANMWMVVVFGAPTLLAFGLHFHAHWFYYVGSPVLVGLLFLIPCVLSVLLALSFATIISPNRGREVLLILFIASLALFITYLNAPTAAAASHTSDSRAAFLRMASITSSTWSPAALCANALRDLAYASWNSSLYIAALLMTLCCGAAYGTRIALELFHERAFTRSQSHRSPFKINSRASQRISRSIFPLARQDRRAIAVKEFKIFSRDLAHTIQLGMLLTICFVYLYNFRVLRTPSNLSQDAIRAWETFLMVCNVGLSSLVVTSICSRFVFPSVSLEGQSFWILQSSPISTLDILKTKFRAWFIPLASISSVVFISGAMALNADGPLVIASTIGGIILCYGLVGMGVGLGAVFSQFDWDYSAQLSTNLGSFLFMVASIVVLAIDLRPLGIMFAAYMFIPFDPTQALQTSSLVIFFSLLTLFLLNRVIVAWALGLGARSLEPK